MLECFLWRLQSSVDDGDDDGDRDSGSGEINVGPFGYATNFLYTCMRLASASRQVCEDVYVRGCVCECVFVWGEVGAMSVFCVLSATCICSSWLLTHHTHTPDTHSPHSCTLTLVCADARHLSCCLKMIKSSKINRKHIKKQVASWLAKLPLRAQLVYTL